MRFLPFCLSFVDVEISQKNGLFLLNWSKKVQISTFNIAYLYLFGINRPFLQCLVGLFCGAKTVPEFSIKYDF